MLIPLAIAILLLAALGHATVRTAPAIARWLALWLAVAFAVVVGLADRTAVRVVPPQVQQVTLDGDAVATRTALLLAAATAGPTVHELQLRWQSSWLGAPAAATPTATAAFGADSIVPTAMPFAPADVRIRALSALAVERPALFEVEVLGLQVELPMELSVVAPDGVSKRESLVVGSGATAVAFLPSRSGHYDIVLLIRVGEHEVRITSGFEVGAPDEVLVVEPSGVVAAALRAQGERVREVSLWPADWTQHQRIVLGRALPVNEQVALVRAVHDGTGLFLLPAAFGDDGTPLRELLPLRLLPVPEPEVPGEGPLGNGDERGDVPPPANEPPATEPPANEPPKTEPPKNEPPKNEPPESSEIGGTQGRKPVSKDPIEVDKHSIAMVLVIDRSGSMGTRLQNGLTKMSYAKASAWRTAQALDAGDRVGVVTFGDQLRGIIELPMTDATDQVVVKQGIERLTDRQEYTYLLSGLRAAHGMLTGERAAVKHVVVISDGEFNISQAPALRREAYLMRSQSKITVSIISIIDDQTDAGFKVQAQQIATDGGGAFLATANVKAVPVIVSSEVTRALSRVGRTPRGVGDGDQPADPEPPEEPQPPEPQPPEPKPPEPTTEPPPATAAATRLQVHAVSESPLLDPMPATWPSLGAAVRCEAPLEARVLLVAGDEGWPLLAFANRGLGRVAAFGAELGQEAGREFRAAPQFPGWLAQWLAAIAVAGGDVAAEDLLQQGEVLPRAPVPADVRWLQRVAGEVPVTALGAETTEPVTEPVSGSQVIAQVASSAPWLLLLLLLVAITERVTSWYALRRGRS